MSNAFDESMSAIEGIRRTVEEAKQKLHSHFIKLVGNSEVTLPVHPEMVGKCQLPWVQEAIIAHETSPKGTEYKDLFKLLSENPKPMPMSEPDAKTLLAIVQHVDAKLSEKFVEKSYAAIRGMVHECDMITEAKGFLNQHAQEIVKAYTLGLGTDYREEFLGRYGEPRTPENSPEVSPWRHGAP